MPGMKTAIQMRRSLLLAVAVLAVGSTAAVAVPVGSSDLQADYLFGPNIPSFVGCGVYGGVQDREVVVRSFTETLSSSRVMAYLSVEPLSWLTLYVAGGMGRHELGNAPTSSSELEYEAGFHLNLVDRIILDPTLFEDRIRLNTGASISGARGEWYGDTVDWHEIQASLTLSVVNDVSGNKFFNPESIALYVGPLFSILQGDELEESTQFGLLVGVEVFVSDSLSFNLGMRHIDETGIDAGLHLHF
jgi:opacity protein-like surface antigen